MIAYGEITVSEIHDGVGIDSVDIWFYPSTSQTSLVGGQWTTNAPTSTKGIWIWTKTVTILSNGKKKESSPACITGSSGSAGKGISKIEEEYYLSSSKVEQTGGQWVTIPPAWVYGKYMWTRIKITYKDPVSVEYTTPVCDTSWEAANDFKEELENQITETKTELSGVSTKVDQVEKSITNKVWKNDITTQINNYDTTTVKTIRDQVAENKTELGKITNTVSDVQTTLSTKADGSTVHELSTKVSKIEQDSSGFQQTVEKTYAKKTELDSTATSLRSDFTQRADKIEAKVTSNDGKISSLTTDVNGIKGKVESAEGDIATLTATANGLTTKIENAEGNISVLQQTAKELRSDITDNKGNITTLQQTASGLSSEVTNVKGEVSGIKQTATNLQSRIESTEGDITKLQQQADGFTIEVSKTMRSTSEEFYLSTSPTSLSGGSWSKTAPTWVNGKYIWRRTIITYADGKTEYEPSSTGVCITGNTGASGIGIKTTSVTYQASPSGTTPPTGTWSSSIPSVTQGQYLWSRTVITYTNNTTSTSYSVAYVPKNGTTGNTGTGINNITQEYYLSNSKTTQSGGSWITYMPTWSTGKYLWTRYKITYKNPTSTSYTTPVCDSSWEAVNGIEVGGRNLFLKTGSEFTNNLYEIALYEPANEPLVAGETYTATICTTPAFGVSYIDLFFSYGTAMVARFLVNGTAKQIISKTFTMKYTTGKEPSVDKINAIARFYRYPNDGTVTTDSTIHWVKIEKGNQATDWTPAPEDIDSGIKQSQEAANNAQNAANNAQNKANENENRISISESMIKVLSDKICSVVQDENGSSILTQGSNGFQFDLTAIEKNLNKAATELNNLSGTVENANNVIANLNQTVEDIGKKTAYIKMTIDEEGKPCIELGKDGNDTFKVRITNTSIDFLDGTSKIAYINNQSLYIEKAVIKSELQIGEKKDSQGILYGFIWATRSNGNMGLRKVGGR